MKLLVVFSAITLLFGCASPETSKQRQAEDDQARNYLADSKANTVVSCRNRQLCDKAFMLTKVYVQEKSDMKIQHSDETMIATFNPISYKSVGISALKIPGSGESATIELKVFCKVMESSEFWDCAYKVGRINFDFKPYVESKLR